MKTQHMKILQYMKDHPKKGITIRQAAAYANWPHKRISELQQMGVRIRKVDVEENGERFRRYILEDPKQQIIREMLKARGKKRQAS